LIGSVNASAEWTYLTNGADWASVDTAPDVNKCATTNQSPINLLSEKADAFDYTIYKGEEDAITKDYSNQFNTQNNNNGHTTQVTLDQTGTNFYTSKLAEKVFNTGTAWEGMQFHLHAGSEHTIDGERYDLEMHTVHYPKKDADGNRPTYENEFIASAMGLVFSVDKYTADLTFAQQQVVDNFFDSLKWSDTASPTVDMVTYGSLMELVDFENRWVYKGSVTTPPCATFVYWNVLSTIYPVS
jgi:carbonic anhydrase